MPRNTRPLRKVEVNSLEMETNSVGNVDSKKRIVAVDSGAAKSFMNETHAPSVPTRTLKGSITGAEHVNANGTTMPNLGEKILQVILNNGEACSLRMQITDVHRALLSVSRVSDSGHSAAFRKGGLSNTRSRMGSSTSGGSMASTGWRLNWRTHHRVSAGQRDQQNQWSRC